MPTIHVTIDDPNETLAVVATMLNQGYEVSIDMDRVDLVEPNYMDSAEVEIRERLWGPNSQAAANLKRAEASTKPIVDARTKQARPLPSLGRDGSDFFINGRKVSAKEWDREMLMRQAARDERRHEARQAINEVACPACGASVLDVCRSAAGKGYGDAFVHIDRIRALHTAHEVVRADG